MKYTKHLIAASLLTLASTSASAQEVDRTKYQDYYPVPDYVPAIVSRPKRVEGEEQRPDHIDNSKLTYFPPVFNQDGGSCGSASNEGYNLTYEFNCFHGRNGRLTANQFPSHWIYLLAYQHSDREEILARLGVPTVSTYGGRTYSKAFGLQDCKDEDSGRMQGYDKWLSAMYNRVTRSAGFRRDITTEEGREELKNWLWNHQGDTDFPAGGLACVGVAITNSKTAAIPNTTANRLAGAFGKKYITTWGPTYDHSVTFVGYDDRVEFDLDKDGKVGEKDEDEVGAWIICNSWGDTYGNKGFIYCPYKYGYSVLTDQVPMTPYRWFLRKNYEPKRVFRIQMAYSHRAEIQLLAGVSEDVNAKKPRVSMGIPMFNYDGNPGNKTPAPAIPLLGRWADGKLHTEPMEFGFDVTDLTDRVDPAVDLKYFLQVNTASGAIGSGKVHELTLMNYEGATPESIPGLQVGTETVDIAGGGKTFYVTVVVPGNGYYRPTDVTCRQGVLTWKAPKAGSRKLTGYAIYQNAEPLQTVAADQLSFNVPEGNDGYLTVAALYEENDLTIPSKQSLPASPAVNNTTGVGTITGPIDGTYLNLIRGYVFNSRLTRINLSKARIVEGGLPYFEENLTNTDEIGKQLFYKSTKLKAIDLPQSTISIGTQAFSNCTALTSIVIPDQVETLSNDAFAYCSALTQVTIGSNVRSFKQGVFYSSPVKNVYCKALVPPTFASYLFSSKPTIHVYSDVVDDYKAQWSTWGTIVGDLDEIIPRETDGIIAAPQTQQNKRVYDLTGRQVSPVRPGIYIQNGKLILKQ